jgi:O-antigen ligase
MAEFENVEMENTMSNKRRKTAKQSREIIIAPKKTDWWQPVLFILAGLLIFYPPLVKGLFFNQQMFVSHIITSIVFSLVLFDRIRHKDYDLLRNPLDWAILAYAGAYLLSLIGAVYPGDAIYGFLKALNYFMVYWVVTRVASSYGLVREMLKFLLAGGLVVAVIGILAALGYSNYPSAYENGLINSTLQYSNTMAAYLSVMLLIGVTLLQQEKILWLKVMYSVANFLMAVAILGALSKGAWLILVGGALLLLMGMPGVYRLKSVYYIGLAIGTVVMIYSRFAAAIAAADPNQALFYLGLGVLLAVIGVIVWEGLEKLWRSQRLAPVIITVIFAVSAVVGVFYFGSQVLQSNDVVREVTSLLDIEDSSYVARIEFMRCAVEIVKDHPIIGTGAGGWEALYRQYQNYSYWTSETHNHFLQVWVEAGTIGLLTFLSMWIILLFYVFKVYKVKRKDEDTRHWILTWGIASGALALGAHVTIDFDLSFPAMCMVLWALFALVNSLYSESITEYQIPTKNKSAFARVQVGLAGFLVILLFVSGIKYIYAFNLVIRGDQALSAASQETSINEQLELMNQASVNYYRATQYDPNNSHYWASLSTVYANFFSLLYEQGLPRAQEIRQRTIESIERAADLRSYDIKNMDILIHNTDLIGHMPGFLKLGQLSLKASPNDPMVYKNTANMWWEASQQSQEAGQEEMSLEFANHVLLVEKSLQDQIARVDIEHPYWVGSRLQVDEELQMIFEEAAEYLKQAKR